MISLRGPPQEWNTGVHYHKTLEWGVEVAAGPFAILRAHRPLSCTPVL